MGRGEVFHFQFAPLPWGAQWLSGRRPLGCSLLLCPSAQPVSLMLRLASLLECLSSRLVLIPFLLLSSALQPLFQFRPFAGLPSPFCLISFQLYSFLLSSLFSPPGPLLPLLSSSQAPAFPLSSVSPCSPALVPWWPLTGGLGLSRACPFRLRWEVGVGRQWWLKYLSGGALGQTLQST